MLIIKESGMKKLARRRAEREISGLTEIQIDKKIMELESSKSELDRIQSIFMRSIVGGDTDAAFRKACKMFVKNTKERVRIKESISAA